jgi:hypothetical protein
MTESVKKPIVLSFVQLVTFLFSVGSVLIVGLFMFLSKFIAVPFAGWFWFVLGLMGLFLIVFLFSNKIYVWFLANLIGFFSFIFALFSYNTGFCFWKYMGAILVNHFSIRIQYWLYCILSNTKNKAIL